MSCLKSYEKKAKGFLKGNSIRCCMIAKQFTRCMKKVAYTHNETVMLAENLMLTTNSFCGLCDLTVKFIANRYHTGL